MIFIKQHKILLTKKLIILKAGAPTWQARLQVEEKGSQTAQYSQSDFIGGIKMTIKRLRVRETHSKEKADTVLTFRERIRIDHLLVETETSDYMQQQRV